MIKPSIVRSAVSLPTSKTILPISNGCKSGDNTVRNPADARPHRQLRAATDSKAPDASQRIREKNFSHVYPKHVCSRHANRAHGTLRDRSLGHLDQLDASAYFDGIVYQFRHFGILSTISTLQLPRPVNPARR